MRKPGVPSHLKALGRFVVDVPAAAAAAGADAAASVAATSGGGGGGLRTDAAVAALRAEVRSDRWRIK